MVILCFREYELGVLSFDKENEEFIYNSFIESERTALELYDLDGYYLAGSHNKRSKRLFSIFGEFAACLTRGDIVRLAGILSEDSLFEKLDKLSKINMIDDGYHIRYSNNA